MIVTQSELISAIKQLANRGTVQEVRIYTVRVSVPLYSVKNVRDGLHGQLPITVKLQVRPLSLWQHFTLWRFIRKPKDKKG